MLLLGRGKALLDTIEKMDHGPKPVGIQHPVPRPRGRIGGRGIWIWRMMMDDDINMGQWNVHGLQDSNRCRAIRTWVNGLRYKLSALCLQEVKKFESRAKFQLLHLFLEGNFIMDTNQHGRVDVVVALPTGKSMIDSGCKGDGSFAWAKTRTNKGDLFFGSVYGSYKCPRWVAL